MSMDTQNALLALGAQLERKKQEAERRAAKEAQTRAQLAVTSREKFESLPRKERYALFCGTEDLVTSQDDQLTTLKRERDEAVKDERAGVVESEQQLEELEAEIRALKARVHRVRAKCLDRKREAQEARAQHRRLNARAVAGMACTWALTYFGVVECVGALVGVSAWIIRRFV